MQQFRAEHRCTGESSSGVGGGGSGRSQGDEVGHQEYEVVSASDSHLPSQVSGESSLRRGGGGNNYNSTSPTSCSYQYWRR